MRRRCSPLPVSSPGGLATATGCVQLRPAEVADRFHNAHYQPPRTPPRSVRRGPFAHRARGRAATDQSLTGPVLRRLEAIAHAGRADPSRATTSPTRQRPLLPRQPRVREPGAELACHDPRHPPRWFDSRVHGGERTSFGPAIALPRRDHACSTRCDQAPPGVPVDRPESPPSRAARRPAAARACRSRARQGRRRSPGCSAPR